MRDRGFHRIRRYLASVFHLTSNNNELCRLPRRQSHPRRTTFLSILNHNGRRSACHPRGTPCFEGSEPGPHIFIGYQRCLDLFEAVRTSRFHPIRRTVDSCSNERWRRLDSGIYSFDPSNQAEVGRARSREVS
jgi:hypothetical protein